MGQLKRGGKGGGDLRREKWIGEEKERMCLVVHLGIIINS